ncbi:hypothetical protein D0T12_00275 [Actinomadura spongiicola]|uniref:DUF6745 domain-containing protein n=1 Tax=Actinomadura spongiicola TaxID=2303421 RepID=A0A372GN13_9ACTN|nr:hypothetical protein [Actinomadura spongiicola]RFS86771.1 hypothetical protein D0T12_00275 [Actinomadura spongiicola]
MTAKAPGPHPPPTAEQQALLPLVRDEWVGHGLAAGPTDRAAAEAGVRDVYLGAGRRPPDQVIWLGSPMAGSIGADIRAGRRSLITRRAWRTLPEATGEAIAETVPEDPPETDLIMLDPLPSDLDDPRWGGLLHRLGREVATAVEKGLDKSVGTAIDQVAATWQDAEQRPEVGALPRLGAYPPRMLRQLAQLSFLDRCGIRDPDLHSRGLLQVERSAGAWWPMRNSVILTERPIELHHDAEGRLHNEHGPAVRYPDGWCLWAWHGVTMPREIIEDEVPIARAVSLRNTEQRRCAVEMLVGRAGWHQVVSEAGWPRVGQETPDPGNPGQVLSLWCVESLYDDHLHLLLMTNGTVERDGTRREFGELVPGWIRDPVRAAAWQVGLTAAQYRQTSRRT